MYNYLPAIDPAGNADKIKVIRQLIKKNKLAYLTHFTHIDNLKSILQSGLLSASILRSNSVFSSTRFTALPLPPAWGGFVSLNLSFPDYKLLARLQNHMPSDWVILLIDIKAILDFPCYFFPGRALDTIQSAASPGQYLTDFQSAADLKYLFSDQEEVKRKTLDIPQFYPTNPYSEILVSFPIAPSYILQVHFYSDYKFNQWVLSNTEFAIRQDRNRWACGLQFFSPRSDYVFWKTQRAIGPNESVL